MKATKAFDDVDGGAGSIITSNCKPGITAQEVVDLLGYENATQRNAWGAAPARKSKKTPQGRLDFCLAES